jgi:RimJ/RimL family protein N-acetyltransferase
MGVGAHDPSLNLTEVGVEAKISMASYDTEIFGFPVVQVDELKVRDETKIQEGVELLTTWLNENKISLASARLPENCLRESMFLEECGFRFIEMVLHPSFRDLEKSGEEDSRLLVRVAEKNEVEALSEMAQEVFGYERFHVDPRLDSVLGNQRYGAWVENSHVSETQTLLRVMEEGETVGFFVVEPRADEVYWHLTAIAPDYQGKGYGYKVWRHLLNYHFKEGAKKVTTTISARNVPVLNLYSKMGSSFLSPEMTYHWVAS